MTRKKNHSRLWLVGDCRWLRSKVSAGLVDYWAAYGWLVCTKTRDTRDYGFGYFSGLLRMEDKRTLANIGRQVGVSEQNMQHFISVSPWSAAA